ncbi:Crp/Fnr family transcriptional regulator [Acidovorax sp. SRB_14]|uniref:Crp/Fnr family transcriptional regulator n=1 Tax=Acidovorax sp. SRB_14 TaxID=1962699 RepID=UPI00146AB65D|nr:Crp/Fnr family transcriptional regulator [Acidovorax sp. SRB_14]NMM80241.1 Crp/Fnr family transcriptional regulator [Acidovorax sp. SRB_14]NMM86772.1 Crp/Fnr family transcriptional regulator [Rhodococcus sp. SRB_17]
MSADALAHTCPPRDCADCRLRRNDAFTAVTPQQLAFIESFRSGTVAVPAGAAVIREHVSNGKLFTLYAGWAFRYKTLSDGRRQILNFVLPGDLVGLQQEFGDDAAHGVEAVTDCALCVFAGERLWDLFRAEPRLGYDITWLSARGESFVDENLLTAGQRNATERVAMLLIHLYRRLERIGLVEDASVPFPINQQHIADALGLSLVHTNKTLRRLAKLGLHEIAQGRLRLPNPRALERVAEYYDLPPRRVPLL